MARHLVIGAGASLAEGLTLGLTADQCPPLVSNFAKSLWNEFNPHPILDRFLNSNGYEVSDGDGRSLFYELEENSETRDKVNIEQFFKFAWIHRDKDWHPDRYRRADLPKDYISRINITNGRKIENSVKNKSLTGWENLLLHGIGNPLQLILINGFFEDGFGWKRLNLAQSVARVLKPGDVVLNLNYDTLFELALQQIGISFSYTPNPMNGISVCKPHGSLNLVVDYRTGKFCFGQPCWLGTPAPRGTISFSGLLPPRYGKSFEEIPAAKAIIAPLTDSRPEIVSFWGVGFTNSDIDLTNLYRSWVCTCHRVEIINPDYSVAYEAEKMLGKDVHHFRDVPDWLSSIGA